MYINEKNLYPFKCGNKQIRLKNLQVLEIKSSVDYNFCTVIYTENDDRNLK